MANLIPSFANGSALKITVDGKIIAYATNLSFSDDVTHAGVGGVGSYSYDALEPVQYAARGGFSVTHYSKAAMKAIVGGNTLSADKASNAPTRSSGNNSVNGGDGNSFLVANSFNPVALLASRTFDIQVLQGAADEVTGKRETLKDKVVFTCKDCRLTSYGLSFTPGTLVAEQIGFICIQVVDEQVLLTNTFSTTTT